MKTSGQTTICCSIFLTFQFDSNDSQIWLLLLFKKFESRITYYLWNLWSTSFLFHFIAPEYGTKTEHVHSGDAGPLHSRGLQVRLKRTRVGCVNIVLSVPDARCKKSALAGARAGACCQGCGVSRRSLGSPAASDERAVIGGLTGQQVITIGKTNWRWR